MSAPTRRLAWLLVGMLGLAVHASAEGQVHVVAPSPGPGVDFTSVQAAITAAAEGDTILVRSGAYLGFTLTGKSLALTADAGADVHFAGLGYIAGLLPGQFVSLRGFTFGGDSGLAALRLESNAGAVWIEDCALHGQDGAGLFASAAHALLTQDCASVTLVHCQLAAGDSGVADALRALGSSVHVYGSTLAGGGGDCFPNQQCPTAGAAAELYASFLTAQGSTFTGGTSGPGIQLSEPCSPFTCVPSFGGPALHFIGSLAPSTAFLYSSTLVPGAKLGTCCSFAGPSTDADPGASATVTEISGAALGLDVDSPLREQQASSFVFTGTPGDLVSLHVALAPGDLFKASLGGPWLLSGPIVMALFAAVPAGGVLSVPFLVPALPAGAESLAVTLQAARVAATGGKLIAEPARLVLLEASF
jgi:hypothetical protein